MNDMGLAVSTSILRTESGLKSPDFQKNNNFVPTLSRTSSKVMLKADDDWRLSSRPLASCIFNDTGMGEILSFHVVFGLTDSELRDKVTLV